MTTNNFAKAAALDISTELSRSDVFTTIRFFLFSPKLAVNLEDYYSEISQIYDVFKICLNYFGIYHVIFN